MSWRWAIGMWALIFAGKAFFLMLLAHWMLNISQVASIPLLISLRIPYQRAMRDPIQAETLRSHPSSFKKLGFKKMVVALFWQLDVLGILGLIITFGFILVPFTIAGGTTNPGDAEKHWIKPGVIAPLVVGLVLGIPSWLFWESKAGRDALVPFRVSSSVWSFQTRLLTSVTASQGSCSLGRSWDCLYAQLLLEYPSGFSIHCPGCCV
jgi:SIT family siderophore-iron:H+ symporter-like MFS transporter